MTPEGKVKAWAVGQYDKVFPGHWRMAPRGGPFGKAGTGDHVICWGGVFIMIEVKSLEGTTTPLQLNCLRAVIAAGGVAAVLKGKDLAKLHAVQRAALAKMKPDMMALAMNMQTDGARIWIDESTIFQGK
jgi:hypothetical protein